MKTGKAVFLGAVVLMIVSLMLPLGCTSEAETDSPASAEFKTYSKYGFSFEYPRSYSISEYGLLESEASDNTGMVQAARGDEDLYQVAWISMIESTWEIGGDMQMMLEDGFWGIEHAEGVVGLDRGELAETTHAGHPMLYQFFSITATEIGKVYGIQAIFYCDRSERVFQLFTMHTNISSDQGILEDFQCFADSLVCH